MVPHNYPFPSDDLVAHHAVNAAAISIPFMTVWMHAPAFFAATTGCLGSLWYLLLFYKEFKNRKK